MPLAEGLLEDFRTAVFVETGSHRGDGIQRALDAGYEAIYSVEISPFAYGWCSHRFQDNRDRVHLVLGDSRAFIAGLITRTITSRTTFWLDAHHCGGNAEMDGADGGAPGDHPLLEELRLIGQSHIRNHHLLIDDIRMFGSAGWPRIEDVHEAIFAINPDYRLSARDSQDFKTDVLIARAPD